MDHNISLAAFGTKQLGRWCKVGAWSVLGLGILSATFNAIYAWHMYMQIQSQSFNFTFDSQNNSFAPNNYSVLPYLAEICQDAILPFAIFIVLFIAGTICTTLAASTVQTPQDTEDIVYEPLTVPAKRRD